MADHSTQVQTVSFIAAGPGEIDLMTVRAHKLLASADVVLADPEVVLLAEHVSSGEIAVALDTNGVALSLAARTKFITDARKLGIASAEHSRGD